MSRLKRTFDVGFSTGLIVLFSPLFLVVALAVKLTSEGSVLHWSVRVGTERPAVSHAKVPQYANQYSPDRNSSDLRSVKVFDSDRKVFSVRQVLTNCHNCLVCWQEILAWWALVPHCSTRKI